jgi:hypothetical protein
VEVVVVVVVAEVVVVVVVVVIIIIINNLHYSIYKKLGTETAENWYSHIPKPVPEHEDITVLWIKEYKR